MINTDDFCEMWFKIFINDPLGLRKEVRTFYKEDKAKKPQKSLDKLAKSSEYSGNCTCNQIKANNIHFTNIARYN